MVNILKLVFPGLMYGPFYIHLWIVLEGVYYDSFIKFMFHIMPLYRKTSQSDHALFITTSNGPLFCVPL